MTVSDLLDFYSPRLEDMGDLALILDQTGAVLFANEAVRKIQSAQPKSLAPEDIIEQLQTEGRAGEFSNLPDNTPPVREARLRVILPDGAGTRHVNWKFVGIPATDGAITLAWGTFRATGPGQEMGFTVLPNGIIQAAKHGTSIEGATLYCNTMPCIICSKMVINAGIKRVVYLSGYPDQLAEEMIRESGVLVEKYEEKTA